MARSPEMTPLHLVTILCAAVVALGGTSPTVTIQFTLQSEVFSGDPDLVTAVPPSRGACAALCGRKSRADCAGFSFSKETRSCRLFGSGNLAMEEPSDQQAGVKSYRRVPIQVCPPGSSPLKVCFNRYLDSF